MCSECSGVCADGLSQEEFNAAVNFLKSNEQQVSFEAVTGIVTSYGIEFIQSLVVETPAIQEVTTAQA